MCELVFLRRWLNAIGLLLSIIGVVFIWIWGPPQPSFEQGAGYGLEDGTVLADGRTVAQRNVDNKAMEQRYKLMSRIGLGLILVGFILQLANEVVSQDHR